MFCFKLSLRQDCQQARQEARSFFFFIEEIERFLIYLSALWGWNPAKTSRGRRRQVFKFYWTGHFHEERKVWEIVTGDEETEDGSRQTQGALHFRFTSLLFTSFHSEDDFFSHSFAWRIWRQSRWQWTCSVHGSTEVVKAFHMRLISSHFYADMNLNIWQLFSEGVVHLRLWAQQRLVRLHGGMEAGCTGKGLAQLDWVYCGTWLFKTLWVDEQCCTRFRSVKHKRPAVGRAEKGKVSSVSSVSFPSPTNPFDPTHEAAEKVRMQQARQRKVA